MARRESLHHEFPDSRVDLEANPEHVRVKVAGDVLADSRRSLIARETKHDPVAGHVASYPDRVEWEVCP